MQYIASLRRTGWEIAASATLALLTLFSAVILLLGANGYVIDYEHLTIEQAGLIVVRANPRSSVVTFPDRAKVRKFGQEYAAELRPGRYEVAVNMDGYTSWTRSVEVKPGAASVFGNVTLFLESPTLKETRTANKRDLESPLVDDMLSIRGTELLARAADADVLISRFSRPVRAARYLDESHVVYLIGSEVHVIDVDGRNDIRLSNVRVEDLCRFRIEDSGKILTIVQGLFANSYRIQ